VGRAGNRWLAHRLQFAPRGGEHEDDVMNERRLRVCWLVSFAVIAGCGGSRSPSDDAGTDVSGDAGLDVATDSAMACDEPASECPEELPLAGGPCVGGLHCEYVEWAFDCTDGAWQAIPMCVGCAPPLAEICRDPFDGSLDDGTVTLGPGGYDAFRPFATDERVVPVWGGQGLAMVELRVQVDHPTPPACVNVSVTASLDGLRGERIQLPVVMRCGQTAPVLTILPDNPCEFRDYEVTLEVDLGGIGTATTTLVLEGGGCPRAAPG
jgi:hypothetical protein